MRHRDPPLIIILIAGLLVVIIAAWHGTECVDVETKGMGEVQ